MPGDDPKARLVDAAARVLIRDGLGGLTTRRLAREAGVNHGLVHYHFGSLDAVLGAVMDAAVAPWLVSLALAAQTPEGFLASFRGLRAEQDQQIANGQAKLRAELALAAANDPQLRDRWAPFVAARLEFLSELVANMIHEYGLSPGVAVPATALLSALLYGREANGLSGSDAGDAELDRWIEGWLLALGDPEEPGPPPGVRPG